MPVEINRQTSTRRLWNPDSAASDGTPPAPSDSDVIVEVIDEITFIDPSRQYQQFTWTFDNSDASSRIDHKVRLIGSDNGSGVVIWVQSDGSSNGDPNASGSKIDVLRVGEYKTKEGPDQKYWETWTTLDNADEGRFALNYTPGAGDDRVTHDVKIWSKDGSAWVLIRRTDSFKVKARADEQYWETVFALDNKDHDAGDPPPSDLAPPTTTWDNTTINPPYRLDPFQNIVDVSWGGLAVIFYDGVS